jgi:hypothetical protein
MLMHSRGKGSITFLDLELKIIVEKRETKKVFIYLKFKKTGLGSFPA